MEGEVLLVRDLVLPEQLNGLGFEDLLSCGRAGALVQDRCEDFDVFFWLREQASTTRLEELVLLVCAVLLQSVPVEVVTYPEFTGVGGSLVDLCEVGMCGRGREHRGASCVDAEGCENVLFEVLAKLLTGNALEDYAGPVKIDLFMCQYTRGADCRVENLHRTPIQSLAD